MYNTLIKQRFVIADARPIAHDDASDAEEAAAAKKVTDDAAAAAAAKKAEDNKGITFTPEQQAHIDSITKENAEKAKRALTEYEALKARTDLTAGQRKDIEDRYETMQQEWLTKEELFERDKKKNDKKHGEEVVTLTAEKEGWKNKFTESTIIRAITDASVKNEAFDSDTIVAILRPDTHLIESLDEDKQPTGKYDSKVKFMDPEGKDGKPADMLLSVSEAVKRMAELDKYSYLFKGKGAGGANLGKSSVGGKNETAESLAKDTVAYRKARKEGRI